MVPKLAVKVEFLHIYYMFFEHGPSFHTMTLICVGIHGLNIILKLQYWIDEMLFHKEEQHAM